MTSVLRLALEAARRLRARALDAGAELARREHARLPEPRARRRRRVGRTGVRTATSEEKDREQESLHVAEHTRNDARLHRAPR
jgi:hypothetical protein